jgi:hypothetical protein
MLKRGFVRSKANARQVELVLQKRLSGEINSNVEAVKDLPFTPQRFGKLFNAYKLQHGKDPQSESEGPKLLGSRPYIDQMKAVSAAVVEERKKAKKKRRSTATIIKEMKADQLIPNSVNRHVKSGLAGESPKKRCRQNILPDDAVIRVIEYTRTCAIDLEPLGVGEVNEAVQALVEGTELQAKFKNGVVSKGHTQRLLDNATDVLQREFPQAMTHERADWCTWENIKDYFDIMEALLVALKISRKNPKWEGATEEERKTMVSVIHDKTQNICGADEMPFGLDMNKGQKGKKDKKVTAVQYDASFEGASKARRGKTRGHQRTTKFNKLGTLVYGSKANGEPLIPMLIVKAAQMHQEYTYSDIITADNGLEMVSLSKVFSGGQWWDPVVVSSPNGGMTPALFIQFIEFCVLPCYPFIGPDDKVLALWDGDQSHMLNSDKLSEFKAKGLEILPPKPNTSSDCQREDLANFPVMQPEIRSQVAKRQRMLRKIYMSSKDPAFNRKLGPRDMVAIAKHALDKGSTTKVNLDGWRMGGIVPFTRAPMQQPHILQTKGKQHVKKLLNWEALDYSMPVTPQIREQLGKGRRMTTGVICDRPMTCPEVIRLFAALEKEKQGKLQEKLDKAAAALEKKKAKLVEAAEKKAAKEAKGKGKEAEKGGKKGETKKKRGGGERGAMPLERGAMPLC